MGLSYFVFGGVRSLDYNIAIESYPQYTAAERDIETIDVPGRSGSLIVDNRRYKNVKAEYSVYFNARARGTYAASAAVADWLSPSARYMRLEDTYMPDIYRMAVFAGPLEIDNWMMRYGRAKLSFDCRPQKWLKSGQYPVEIANGGKLNNRWREAQPLIEISGSGSAELTVGASTVVIDELDGELTVDCEIMDVYSGVVNKNNAVKIYGGFPTLPRGDTVIGWSGGISAVKITPRWWML